MESKNIQTIYVMWLREMKRFFRAKSRVIGALAMPFFFLFSIGFGFRSGFSLPDAAQGIDYIDFLVPGILGMTMLFTSTFAGLSVLWDKEFGFLKEMMVAPVRRSTIVFGRIAGGITTSLIQGLLILIISFFLGFKLSSLSGILLAFIFMFLIGVGFIGFGIAMASKMNDVQGFSLIIQFIIFPTFLFSGALFPVSNFPPLIRIISYINPLTYGVDGLRASLIGFSQFPLAFDFLIIVIFDFVMISLATWLFGKTEV